MILVDTSVWIDHFRGEDNELRECLDRGIVLIHPFVIVEIACGNLKNRSPLLEEYYNADGYLYHIIGGRAQDEQIDLRAQTKFLNRAIHFPFPIIPISIILFYLIEGGNNICSRNFCLNTMDRVENPTASFAEYRCIFSNLLSYIFFTAIR